MYCLQSWPFTLHHKQSMAEHNEGMSSSGFQCIHQYSDYWQNDRHFSMSVKASIDSALYQTNDSQDIESHNYC